MRLLVLCLLLLIGCRSAQKASDSINFEEKKSTADTVFTAVNLSTQIDVTRKVDSSLEKVTVGKLKIYPRGEFIIGTDGTFQGSADSVVTFMQEQESKTIQIQDLTRIKLDSSAQESKSSRSNVNTSLNQEKKQIKRKPSFVPYIALAIGALLVIFGVNWWFSRPKIP